MERKKRIPYKTDEERKRNNIHIRMTDEEMEILAAIAEHYGKTNSATVLYLIRSTYADLAGKGVL